MRVQAIVLNGGEAQDRWRARLAGRSVLWVGVMCPADVAVAREAARGDRLAGMAAWQAERLHDGVAYDMRVDSSAATPQECARRIAGHIAGCG